MGENTAISWTDHTFNPWWGCTKVSPGCTSCYAETFSNRLALGIWGANAPRRFFGDKHWNEPRKWNAKAAKAGARARVFCASMADVFEDRRDLDAPRARLWDLIEQTPALDWLLLTKRPERMIDLSRWGSSPWPRNVWAGTTVEDQRRADERIPWLLRVPAAVRFLSCEPLMEGVDIGEWLDPSAGPLMSDESPIDWVICGGESGGRARPFDLAWARSLRDQCAAAGVPYFFKQAGARPVLDPATDALVAISARSGADPAEWPEDLRVQQFPEVARD